MITSTEMWSNKALRRAAPKRSSCSTTPLHAAMTLLLLAVVGLSGCSSPSTTAMPASTSSSSRSRDARTAELRAKLKSITVADGISKSEAELIAECYFHQNVGCGGYTGVRDGSEYWIVDGAFGMAAQPIKGFHIDKGTGKIKSPIGPSYASPFEIFP